MVFTKKLCYTDSKGTFEPINKEDIPMQLTVRQPSASEDAKHYTTERLRGEYLIETVFAPDDAILTYSHFDRIIAGVMPVSKSVELVGCKELASDTFLQRREMGVINIGGKGKIAVDGVEYDLKQYDGLYVGMGAKTLSFTSDDPADPAMLLMLDYGVFYEFIPLDQLDQPKPQAVPLWGVEPGRNYAMVISTSCGLWRYMIGDTVRFTSVNPYKFVISGRTKSFINAFGEELIVDNAEQALASVCAETGAEVEEYTAAPVFMDEQGKCRHQWVVEFRKTPPSLSDFARRLDQALQAINSDYEAKRFKDITLQQLEIVPARRGLFSDWLRSRGKLGGQHKVPRLSNSREIIEQILALNHTA